MEWLKSFLILMGCVAIMAALIGLSLRITGLGDFMLGLFGVGIACVWIWFGTTFVHIFRKSR